jgi:hypothetical protein
MDVFTLLREPFVVVGLAIVIFVVRVMYLARRLRSAARNPTLVDLRALEDARKSLDNHKESIRSARVTLEGNLEGARDTLRHYRKPLDRARRDRQNLLSGALRQDALEEAKQLYQSARPKSKRASSRELVESTD